MLRMGLVDVIGTDAHSDRKRGPYLKECAEYLYKKYPAEYVDSLLYGRAVKRASARRVSDRKNKGYESRKREQRE